MLLQTTVDLTGGGPLALVVTFLLVTVLYAVTLHLAATFFLGDVPSQKAATAAPVPALTSILLQQYGAGIVVPVTMLGDLVAIRFVYGLKGVESVVLTVLHFIFFAALGIALVNLFGLV